MQQNIGAQRCGDYLVFYARNGVLDLQSLGKGIRKAWDSVDWNAVHAAIDDGDTLYFEAVGNHRDFDYRSDFPPDGNGLIAFALRKANDLILNPTKLPFLPLTQMAVQTVEPVPDLQELRRLLDSGREGYVFTGYEENGDYVAYKAKRRELLEEVADDDREVILAGSDRPEVKIGKVVCTIAKVKHILQKLKDGEFAARGDGIGADGRWDGSNAIIPTLIKVVQDDCWAESGETIRELQKQLDVSGKKINHALEDRTRSAFFELTLRESLA